MEIAVQTAGLTKYFGKNSALEGLDLTIAKGEVLGYLGPNGAGKTTTIRLLLGLLRPTAGSATIFGLDAQKDKVSAHRRLAYVAGETDLWPSLTGMEALHLLANIHGSVDESYRQALIQQFRFDPNKRIRTYSKGNRQKISLIAAFASRAELLVLDEPTAGLDPLMQQVFRECVAQAKKDGQTVFLSSHILEEVAALCDRVGVLREGKLIELGTLAEMRHLSAVIVEATFAGKPPSVTDLKGVKDVQVSGHTLTCHVEGAMDAFLATVVKAKPLTLLSRQPSLEELFLSLYGQKEATVA